MNGNGIEFLVMLVVTVPMLVAFIAMLILDTNQRQKRILRWVSIGSGIYLSGFVLGLIPAGIIIALVLIAIVISGSVFLIKD